LDPVRPNGPGAEGHPVLIQPAADGAYRVIGGRGDKPIHGGYEHHEGSHLRQPAARFISTSHIERENPTMRMHKFFLLPMGPSK
jgi:hypothetical protein